ncbi:MAG: hypothetical protein RI885_1434 [Actinomycetota bacterium]
MIALPRRFVALGDSFTEGVGDASAKLPNGVRGWADRVAERLAKHDPGWEYANLAVRSKRLRQIVADQVPRALELKPGLITMYAGGNDILDVGTDVPRLMADYGRAVAALTATGARVLLFTGYDIPLVPARALFRGRNRLYNEAVRRIADEHGAEVVDFWAFDGLEDRGMWAADRLHLSKAGHKLVAAQVLDQLGVPHPWGAPPPEPSVRRSIVEWERAQRRWAHDWVLPLLGRKIRRVTLGDDLRARFPDPVAVPRKGGLRRLPVPRP